MTRLQPRYQPGDHIDSRYQVHKALMGGMGEVYLCLDLEENYPYALKTFQQRYLADPRRLRQAFEQEVATWVALEKHPNIVRCFDMRTLDNQLFMRLEWVASDERKGNDLRGWLRYGPLSLKQALQISLDLCWGLRYTQERQPGLVHRDLKPENILIAQGKVAKITDFGLVQIIKATEFRAVSTDFDTAAVHTMIIQNGIVGTPTYMAPEQWRNRGLDQRTDIYALGCILYELLTGQPPHQLTSLPRTADEIEAWLQSLQTQHEQHSFPYAQAALPKAVSDLIQRCLAKQPADRPSSMDALADQLTEIYSQLLGQDPPKRPEPGRMTDVDYNNRGVTYAALQQQERALADYNQAIQLDANDATGYINRGATYAALQQPEQAVADLTHALQLDPTEPQTYSNRGVAYAALQQPELALADYNQAINLNPTFAQAYHNRGITYVALQQYELAVLDYNQAIAFAPTEAKAFYNRGNTYAALGHDEQAMADYRQAIALDPTFAQAFFNLGALLVNTDQPREALPHLEIAAQLGVALATQVITQVRQTLEQTPTVPIDRAQQALDAFVEATTRKEMQQVVTLYPLLADAEFIMLIEQQILAQIPTEHQPAFQARFLWLRQIVDEQKRRSDP